MCFPQGDHAMQWMLHEWPCEGGRTGDRQGAGSRARRENLSRWWDTHTARHGVRSWVRNCMITSKGKADGPQHKQAEAGSEHNSTTSDRGAAACLDGRAHLGAAREGPQPHVVVAAPRRDSRAVGAECDAADGACVAGQRADALRRLGVPDHASRVLPSARTAEKRASHSSPAPSTTMRLARHYCPIARQLLSRAGVRVRRAEATPPLTPAEEHPAPRGDLRPVRLPAHAHDVRGVAALQARERLPRGRVHDQHAAPRRRGHHGRIRREAHAGDRRAAVNAEDVRGPLRRTARIVSERYRIGQISRGMRRGVARELSVRLMSPAAW